MFPKKEVEFKFDIIIGPSSIIKGDIESEGSIRIDGKVLGDVKSLGNIIVTEEAYINGSLTCINADIYGIAEGNVKTKGKINLYHKASLKGDIICKSFNTEEGATFKGNCFVDPEEEIIIEVDAMISEKNIDTINNNLIDFKKTQANKNRNDKSDGDKPNKENLASNSANNNNNNNNHSNSNNNNNHSNQTKKA
ncbi:bactofilin family protein [Fusibacter ferrireducens]|uniref:Polymer-forming cytoskeletal protein n=1 Tax=Fusibacter ferrireducens TaxID=2785058 RepID=A0ABR9ZWJ3_9FIRM|nr:polymer-forming cytoskeletal protein [Fusibacter ferrireducens]MBF4694811.1 polymer-forming cytoskeletal protein [Fusibacter ferrireducens]